MLVSFTASPRQLLFSGADDVARSKRREQSQFARSSDRLLPRLQRHPYALVEHALAVGGRRPAQFGARAGAVENGLLGPRFPVGIARHPDRGRDAAPAP